MKICSKAGARCCIAGSPRLCAIASPTLPQPSRKCSLIISRRQVSTDAAIEWWGKAGDQALRRSAFQEAISHLGKAIEMADKEGEGAPRAAATPATASVGQRLKLQTSYGQALIWSKGYASEETKAAVSRAQELAGNVDDPSERFAIYYGQWAGHLLRART